MIRPNSCFGYSLQTGTRLVSIFQMVLAVALVALTIKRITSEDRFDSWVSVSIFLIVQVLLGLFSFLLFEGSKDRNLRSCTNWIYATIFLTVVTGIYVLFELYDNSSLRFYSSGYILLSIFSVISNIGFVWVTYGYVYELREEEGEGGTIYNT